MVTDHERDYPSRRAAVVSIAEKIGGVPQTLHEWVKKAEVMEQTCVTKITNSRPSLADWRLTSLHYTANNQR